MKNPHEAKRNLMVMLIRLIMREACQKFTDNISRLILHVLTEFLLEFRELWLYVTIVGTRVLHTVLIVSYRCNMRAQLS